MKFKRPRIIEHQPTASGVDANGNPTTTAVVVQTLITDLILGNGSSQFEVHQPPSGPEDTDTTVETITSQAFAAATPLVFPQNVNGSNQVFVHLNVINLGTLTNFTVLIEFNDPDHPTRWIPTLENVDRSANALGHTSTISTTGRFVLASRVEHLHFDRFRVTFAEGVGTSDADTQIETSWFHAGKKATVAEQ